jgi:hypothetical protein
VVAQPEVVGVEKRGDLPPRESKSGVPRRRVAAVRLPLVPEAIPVRRQDALRPVGRAVVDDDELEIAKRLLEDASDRRLDDPRPVERRYDYRDVRRVDGPLRRPPLGPERARDDRRSL